ncbi:hypothetical protein OBBRIDRAFT_216415 [Obba rivulosa]|uniref:Uncharacterized protein n=1 Tax=Obba rivulosa TaxID=1052685 RepID=A0A8E2DQQ2_9APHY|nr:hypothetical protein OBBRIDRAFT_216415 [Obba rivulosa]
MLFPDSASLCMYDLRSLITYTHACHAIAAILTSSVCPWAVQDGVYVGYSGFQRRVRRPGTDWPSPFILSTHSGDHMISRACLRYGRTCPLRHVPSRPPAIARAGRGPLPGGWQSCLYPASHAVAARRRVRYCPSHFTCPRGRLVALASVLECWYRAGPWAP